MSTSGKQTYFWRRFLAFLIDATIGLPLGVYFPAVGYLLYEAGAVNQWGMTLGKLLVGLRVVRDDGSGRPPGIWYSILRSVMKLMPLFWPLILFGLWKNGRGWHDRDSHTNMEPLRFTRKQQIYRVVLSVLWGVPMLVLLGGIIANGFMRTDAGTNGTAQDVQATTAFVQKLSPLLPLPGDASRTPDERYRLCIETAQREFGSQTTREQRESVCKDYAYTTAEQADAALRQLYDEIAKVPVAQRSAWCLENGPYLFPKEQNLNLSCMFVVEHWDEFWKGSQEKATKNVKKTYR